MPHSADIPALVEQYLQRYPAERDRLSPLLSRLADKTPPTDLFSRTDYRGHITASAVALCTDPTAEVLLIFHNRLGRLLQPGGHVEPGDATLPEAAARELAEETGLIPPPPLQKAVPLDIDCHLIPASPKRNEPEHYHLDFRYVFPTPATVRHAPPTLQLEEVTAATWHALDDEQVRQALGPHLHDKLRLLAPR